MKTINAAASSATHSRRRARIADFGHLAERFAAERQRPSAEFHRRGRRRAAVSVQGDSALDWQACTFAPGARSAWHTHPAGQVLIVTDGVGWVQEEGGAKREIKPGDVVWCPPGVKHWHGATATTGVRHIAITGTVDGENMEEFDGTGHRRAVSEVRSGVGAGSASTPVNQHGNAQCPLVARFAATQQFGSFRSEADIQRAFATVLGRGAFHRSICTIH